MSGHSHWAGIKQRKGVNDAKRAKIFTVLAKPIVIAAQEGGNPDTNFKLRSAIDKALSYNMPKANIERAVKRGTGELKGDKMEEIIYEAMGPGNVMMLVKTTTDNRNRTLTDVRTALTKNGGKFGEAGSAMWNFDQVGVIIIETDENTNTEELELAAIEAGAKDMKSEEEAFIIFTEPTELQAVQDKLKDAGIEISEANLSYLPKTTAEIDEKTREAYEKLLEILDELDDVDEIYDNL